MNINGIPGPLPGVHAPGEINRVRVEQERAERTASVTPQPAPPASNGTLGATRPQPSLPVEPPAGTDPELWSILSAEERVFFAKVGAMGPLTYGRVSSEMNAQPSVTRGGRLNVKA